MLHKTTPAMVERLLKQNTPGATRIRAVLRGDAFRGYTWEDVFEVPGQMMRELIELLR